jgi:hypothetical protein
MDIMWENFNIEDLNKQGKCVCAVAKNWLNIKLLLQLFDDFLPHRPGV